MQELEQEKKNVEDKFEKLKQQGAVLEADIAKHQNALAALKEEMLRLQGEWRALENLINKQTAPCPSTQSNQETDSQK